MKILFIANGLTSRKGLPGVSGGDIRWIEIGKNWSKKHTIHILSTKPGIDLCKKLNLKGEYHILKSPSTSSYLTYIIRFINSKYFLPASIMKYCNFDIIYTTTEHYYDVFPALEIKRKNKNAKWAAVAHWVAPIIRKNKILSSILFYLQQRIGYKRIKRYADVVLAVSSQTKNSLKKIGFDKSNIKVVECGINYNEIKNIAKNQRKMYDAVFMKRFHPAKGIFDVIAIWENVVRVKKDAKLILIGDGPEEIVKGVKDKIKRKKLEKNIEIVGVVYNLKRKFELLGKSKIFVLPTYEENWAIVIGEAMAANIPVICYNLKEIVPIWKDNVKWIEKGDIISFSKKIIEYLNCKNERNKLSKKCSIYCT